MNINYDKLTNKGWFEDADGKEIVEVEGHAIDENYKACDFLYYHRCFPMELHDTVDEFCYHPKNPIIQFICRYSKTFYSWISKGKKRTFRHIFESTTTFGATSSQECIVAMVNSGEFTLEQAVWVYANSCERCTNSLLYKYLNGTEGYEEFSEQWHKTNMQCDFCKKEKV